MDMNNLNSLVLCYKYTISKLFYVAFMMNVIDRFASLLISIGIRRDIKIKKS